MSSKKSSFHCASSKSETAPLNEFSRLFSHYKNLALNLYRWENLPNGIESRHIEEALFGHGQAVFTDDSTFGLMCLPSNTSQKLNIYGDPTAYVLTGIGYTTQVSAEDGVRIMNNDQCLPTVIHITHFAEKMAEIESVIRQNLRQQRFPYIVATNKNNELTMRNIINKIEQGEEAIFVDKTLTEEGRVGIETIRTDAPYLVDKLEAQKKELEVEILTFLGLNSAREKGERLLADEVNANNTIIQMSLDLGLKSREEAVKKINAKYGLNIEVFPVIQELEPLFTTTLEDKGGVEDVE